MEEHSVSMGWIPFLLFLLLSSRSCEESSPKTCCQMSDSTSSICTSNSTCVIKFSDSNLLSTSKHCGVIQDTKFENTNKSDTMKVDCIRSNFDVRQRFEETDTLPFHIELFNMEKDGESFIGFDVRLHYMEFVRARFRLMNLHHCKSPFGDISPQCNPRCVKLTKNDKLDNQAFLSYDCESGFTQDASGHLQPSTGDTYLFSMCMTDSGEGQTCGEYWFLVPPDTTVLDTSRPDHQVLLLVDRTEYDQNTEVVVYIPASHVIKHDADMLSVQLLHDSAEPMVEDPFVGEGCWHNKSTAAVIHVQNITFNKFPGHNIRVRITHHLPSGKYQVAMVPFRKDENGTMVAMGHPSCSTRLERLNLGKHALLIILVMLGVVIFSGLFATMYNVLKEDETFVKDPCNVVVVADFDISEKHNKVMNLFFQYLRIHAGVEKMYYAPDSRDGIDYMINMMPWVHKSTRDPKTIKDGFLIFVAGPPIPKEPPKRRKYPNLVNIQMENLTEKEESPSSYLEETPAQKLTLNAAVLQERVVIIKFPYSDLSTIPAEMPRKAVYNSVISIPQDIRELIRLLQRSEQLSTPMNLQLNMNDTELGQKILTAIKQVCAEQKQEITSCQVPEKQSWKTVIKKSVSFLSGGGGDGLDTLLVPLATSEVYEDKDETSV